MTAERFIIFGLGNPGAHYARTRHNLGFMVVDTLSRQYDIPITKLQHHAFTGEGFIAERRVVLAQPQTYVNLSGRAAAAMVNFWQLPLPQLFVVCDDLDLPLGKVRIRRQGSPGGHNGLKSITQSLGSREFPRLRIGIGRPQEEEDDVIDHVLSPFSRDEWALLEEAILRAADAAVMWLTDGVEAAMNKFNS